VVREGVAQHVDDRLFSGAIHLGDEVVGRLGLHGQQVELGRGAVDDGRGATGGLDGDVQGGMHAERSRLKNRGLLRVAGRRASTCDAATRLHTFRAGSPAISENAEF
jgi:hypothetical protein